MASLVEEATPPWEKLPPEITAAILRKLGPVEILMTAVKVCPTWRHLCHDPSMWRYINLEYTFRMSSSDHLMIKICRRAVDLSQGQLIGISIKGFWSDDLLRYISQRSGQLKHLEVLVCNTIIAKGMKEAVKNLPLLEDLHLHYTYLNAEAVETIGRSCPLLKTFTLTSNDFRRTESDDEAFAIAENMHGLKLLHLIGNRMTNIGFKAIVEACPHLETIYMKRCHYVDLDRDLGKECSERIKGLKLVHEDHEDYYYEDYFYEDEMYDEYDDGYFDD